MPRHGLDAGRVLHATRKFILAGESGAGGKQEELEPGAGETREGGSHCKHRGKLLFLIESFTAASLQDASWMLSIFSCNI